MIVIYVVLSLVLACVIIYFGWRAVDSWLVPRENGQGRVTKKTFTPAHFQTILVYSAATKTNMPQIIPYPDSWVVMVDIAGQHCEISVAKEFYDAVKENDLVTAEYVRGRFSKKIYIKGVSCFWG